MANTLARVLLMLVVAGSILMNPTGNQVLAAQDGASNNSKSEPKKRKTRKAMIIRQKVSKKLNAAQKLTEQKQYQDALDTLDDIVQAKRSDYEKALAHNMKAYVYFLLEDYKKAQGEYGKVLSLEKVPDTLVQTAQLSLTKAHMIQEQYALALTALERWFALVEKPAADQYVLRAQLKFQLKDYKGALPDVKHAINSVKKKGKKPKESWLLVERAVYFQNNDFVALERCLSDLITYYPKQQYWTQLSYIYSELGKQNKSLVALETAYEQDLLAKESQYISLAQYMLSEDTPYKAAQVILTGIKSGKVESTGKNLSLLGDALMMAKEYKQAIKVLTQAASKTQDNKDYYKLSQIHAERQEWQDANINIKKALTSKQFKYYDDAMILHGLVLFNLNELVEAKAVFEKASLSKDKSETAQKWITFIESEQKRQVYMAQ